MAPIRFAIAIDQATLEPWQLDCLAPLTSLEHVIPVARIVTSTMGIGSPESGDPVAGQWMQLPLVALDGAGADAQIRSLEIDFILTWTDEPAVTGLAGTARWGLWRYQLGDWQRLRADPAGFWEVYERQPVSTAMLVQVQPDPDFFIVLREAHVRTHLRSWRGNREQLQARCAQWAAQLCRDIRNGELQQFSSAPSRCQRLRRARPTFGQSIIYAVRILTRIALAAARELFRHEQWNVGVVEQPISAFLEAGRRAPTRWVATPKPSEFLADPFGIVRDGRLTVFCEYLSYRDNRGTIVSIDPTGGASPVHIGPTPSVHLSYPCLIELEDRLLCIPETHEAREVALYEVERFPERWRKAATLLSNTVAVDATAFRHGDLWWLAASTPAPKGANCELHLWYAAAITGPWQAHPCNPVKVDVRSARPGGTPFVHGGVLYRPAQDCSTTYGARTVINRVVTLTPTSFREEFAVAVQPDKAGPYPDGLHTLSAVGGMTLIDAKCTRFVPAQFLRTLKSWVRGAFRRPPGSLAH
jgi:hypothetical protein